MASSDQTIKITFLGADELDSAYKSATSKVESFSGSVATAAAPMADFAKSVLAIEAALISLTGVAIVYATQQFNEFQAAEVALTKVLDDANLNVYPAVAESIRSLSNDYGIASDALTNVTTEFVKSGTSIEEAGELAKLASDLFIGAAEAEFLVEDATSALVRARAAYNLTLEETEELANQWNYTANTNATSVEFLSDAFARVAKVGQDAGYSMAELNGVLTPMIEVFQESEMPATAFKSIIAGLSAPTGALADGLELLGIELQKGNGEWKTAKELFEEVALRISEVDDHTATTASAMIAGKNHANKMAVAWDEMGKSADIAAAAVSEAAQNSLDKEVAKVLDTSKKQIEIWKTTFDNAMIDVGEKMEIGTAAIVAGASKINIAFQDMIDEGVFDDLFKAYNAFGEKLGDFFDTLADDLQWAMRDVIFDDLIASIANVQDKVVEMFDVDLESEEGITEAIQFVVDSIESLQDVVAGIIEGLTPFVDIMKDVAAYINEADTETKEWVGDIGGAALVIAPLATVVGGLAAAAAAIGPSFVIFAGAVGGFISKGIELYEIFTNANSVLEKFEGVLGLLVNPIDTIGEKLLGFAAGFEETDTTIEKAQKTIETLLWQYKALAEWLGIIDEDGEKAAESIQKISDQEAVDALKKFEKGLGDVSETSQGVSNDLADIAIEIDELQDKEVELKVNESQLQILSDKLNDISTYKIDFEEGIDIEFKIGNSVENVKLAEEAVKKLQSATSEEMRLEILADEAYKDIEFVQGRYEQFGIDAAGNPIMLLVDNTDASKKIKETEEEIEKLPHEKLLEIKLQGEIDTEIEKIKAYSDTIQSSMEWEAKVDIAQAETDMERFTTSVEVMGEAVESSGARLVDLYAGYDDASRALQIKMDAQAQQEQKIQAENHALLSESLRLENERNQLINDKLKRGDAMVKVQLDESIEYPMQELYRVFATGITTAASAEGLDILIGGGA